MRIGAILVGALATVTVTGLMLFTAGEVVAIVAFVVLAGATVGAAFVPAAAAGGLLALFAVATLGAIGYGGWNGYQLVSALTDDSGPADPADPAALASAEAKFDAIEGDAAFRLELTEQELTAFVQDGLQDADSPVRSVTIDVVGDDGDEPGSMLFDAAFKSDDLSADGEVSYSLRAGGIELDIKDVGLGAFSIPGVARQALEDLVERVTDLNDTLEEFSVTVQSLRLTDDAIIVIGTQGEGDLLTSQTVLTDLRERAASLGTALEPPPERLGPGEVNGVEAPGAVYYVALGDSLAENVGVAQARDGYVSRLHRQLELRDGADYGLRNFGVSGETSATLTRSGQLDAALDFIDDNEVAYVTLDIGANDLLPHLGSEDCAAGAGAPACDARIAATLESYRANLDDALERLTDAAPDATVVFLLTYSPFSFGFDLAFERDTDRVTQELNAVAAELAGEHGVLVADGFAPLQGRAAGATHMTDVPPDIHPRESGYDALAAAILDALG